MNTTKQYMWKMKTKLNKIIDILQNFSSVIFFHNHFIIPSRYYILDKLFEIF